ncbi:MAG: type IV pilus secretin PilQ [Oligoflexia bacterium]|nr:type IV pilus secretin PilQ [Oligoflexia bacterium]
MNVAARNSRVRRLAILLASISLVSACAGRTPTTADNSGSEMMASNGTVAGSTLGTETANTDTTTDTTTIDAPKGDTTGEATQESAIDTRSNVALSQPFSSPARDLKNEPAPSEEKDEHGKAGEEEHHGAKLVGLSIEKLSAGSNAVVADMKSPGFFTLKKTAPSEYVLTLEGAGLDSSISQALVSPPSSGAIRSVRPVTKGNDVALRIFAQPGSSLTARSENNKIIVSAAQDTLAQSDARAQLAAEKDASAKPAAADAAADKTAEGDKDKNATAANAGADAGLDSDVRSLLEDTPKYTGRLISLDLQDTDIDNALRIIAEVSNLNIIASEDVTGKVTLRLIDVPWDQALDVILKTNGLDKVQEGNVIRIAPVEKLRQEREALKQAQQAEEELEPLSVRYIRISYAKASELKPLVDTVLSERGSATYDERTNQLIIKDIRKGIKNVAELVGKLDLRTPQVLLETQIVEASRSFLRELGAELGFQYLRSPDVGTATGYNFPNSVEIGGGLGTGNSASAFPAAVSQSAGSAVNFLFGSADGSKSLDTRISALESEGRVRVISRPAVATTNNKQATIKSVEKIRVKTPSGGNTVQVGSGATSSGNGGTATEIIEIGITLTVTPQASPDYYVLLDVDAKSSTFGDRLVDGIPSERERSATSSVLVSSGQTFAMGGIYKIADKDNIDGVPFLKDIPFLGHLFRHTKLDKSDEELIFFITPRIVEGSFDDAAMKVAS